MQIAVLSDLHLGSKNGLDRFFRARDAEAHLVELLNRLEKAVDRIILLGDVFETLRGFAPGPLERELRAAMDAYPEISRRALSDPRYQLVQGNHDIVSGRLFGVPEIHRERDHGLELVFFHGHQMDRLARGNAPFSRLGVWLGGMLERFGLPITHRVDAHRAERAPKDDHTDPETHEVAAVAFGKALGADIIVNGHTHRAVHHEIGDHVYLNSGTCLSGRREVVLIDTAERNFEVIRNP